MRILPFVKDTGTGVDGGPLAMLRFARDATRAAMLVLLNRVLESGNVPLTWDIGRLIMCYKGKKACPSEIGSYRPLGVGAMMGKLYTLLLMKRLKNKSDRADCLFTVRSE